MNKPIILALEMVNYEHQHYIEAYLERHITELEFLDSIHYHHSWRFPWTHYRELFELAKKNKIKIIGVNTEGSLAHRDQFAALKCYEALTQNPKHLIITLYGELHILSTKIPNQIKKKIDQNVNITIIHQNLDDIYWKMIQEKNFQGVIEFGTNEFCINSAPPWIKYESMVYWYENLCQDPDFDIHSYLIEYGKKIFNEDTLDDFLKLSKQILTISDLHIDPKELEDFNLYDHTNLDQVQASVKQLGNNELVEFYTFLIQTGHSFRIPGSNIFYCSSYSLNRLSYLVGTNIFYHQLKLNKISAFELYKNLKLTDLSLLILIEAVFGHFFSKIINPYRKCDMYKDLQEFALKPDLDSREKLQYQMALDVLDGKIFYISDKTSLPQLYLACQKLVMFWASIFITS